MTDTLSDRASMLAAFDESTGPVSASRSLPPELYTSTQIWEFEREAIFGNDWLCVGRADQVPEPGDFRTISVIDEPLILPRDREGSTEEHTSELQSLMRITYAVCCLKK